MGDYRALEAFCPTCGGDGLADFVPGATTRPPCPDCGGTGKLDVVPAETLRGAVEERDALRQALEHIAEPDDAATVRYLKRFARATLDRLGGR